MAGATKKTRSGPGMQPIFADAEPGAVLGGRSAYLLTNRNNLIEILSSGFIKPASYARLHYTDLSSHCMGYLPLLLSPPSADLIDSVVREGDYNYPALIDICLDNLRGNVQFITCEGGLSGDIADQWAGAALVVRGVLPVARIRQVIFASEEHRTRVLQADYGNLPRHLLDQSKVESTAFAGHEQEYTILQALEAYRLDDITLSMEAATYKRVEKIAGGLALAATPLAAHPELSFTAIVQSLNLLSGYGLAGETQISLAVASLLSIGVPETAIRSSNQALLTAAADRAVESQLGIPARDLVSRAYAQAVALSGDSGNLQDQLRCTLKVLSDTMTDAEFEQDWPQKHYPVPNAILRFVLRGDVPPTRRQLLDDSNGPADVLSWFLTGLYLGRSRLPSDAYPDRGLLDAIDCAAMRYLNNGTGGLVDDSPVQFSLTRTFGTETVHRDEAEIARFAHRNVFEQLIEYFRSQSKDELDEQAALELCRIMGWAACVHTVIHGLVSEQKDDLKFETAGRDRRLTVSFHGFTTDISQKLKAAEFRRRIAGSFETIPSESPGSDLSGLFRKISKGP